MGVDAVVDGRSVISRWTTRRWLRYGVAVVSVLLIALGSLGVWALARTDQLTDQVVRYRSPALINATRLETALVDQETGIRGYGLSGRREFLEPYTQGLKAERTATDTLADLTHDDGTARADLARVRAKAVAWQRSVARPVAAASAKDAVTVAAARTDNGKQMFDDVRAALTVQQDHLRSARRHAGEELDWAQRLRTVVFSAIAALIVAVTVVIFDALRRGVTTPLDLIGTAVRDIGRGRFDRAVPATGPADLQQLATDVETMRRRLLLELEQREEARDLLDQQAEELRRSNAELEQFAYVASHDLQEPLRKISSFTQLLQRRYGGQLDERADQYIAFAVDGANRMQILINDLLAFSRVGRVHNEESEVDLEETFAQALDSLSVVVEETGASVEHDPLPVVVGDSTQLGLLWQNLLSNALKFRSPDRSPKISVGVRQDGEEWRFTVRDNGIGIAPEFREKVFVIFQRLHTRDAYPGTGIGLAMCKKTVEFHGGTIGIEPVEGDGTALCFTLPLQAPAEADESGASQPR